MSAVYEPFTKDIPHMDDRSEWSRCVISQNEWEKEIQVKSRRREGKERQMKLQKEWASKEMIHENASNLPKQWKVYRNLRWSHGVFIGGENFIKL